MRAGRPPNPGGPSNPNASPRRGPRPRRNSESSVVDPDKPLTEEEKKARDARRRERRHREGKDRSGKPPQRRLDIIDQLDATSIYGTGCKFCHSSASMCQNWKPAGTNALRL
jgi:hypothetical protein